VYLAARKVPVILVGF